MIIDVLERNEAVWKVFGTRDKVVKERCVEAYKKEKRKVKSYIYESTKEVSEQFVWKWK